ncbi:MAG: nucleoside deaminase [Actinomycetaceae bacterium]|nr:nucleoside deaminase [Actinomycetaceae bacterium]
MQACFTLAKHARACGDIPVGALTTITHQYYRNLSAEIRLSVDTYEQETLAKFNITIPKNTHIIGIGYNTREAACTPTGHAEIMALNNAANTLKQWRLDNCTLYVSLEPCTMCAGAIVDARVARLVFSAWDEKQGACGSLRDIIRDTRHGRTIEVIPEIYIDAGKELIQKFFQENRTSIGK